MRLVAVGIVSVFTLAACGSILGIDTSRTLDDGTSADAATDTSSAQTGTSGGPKVDSGTDAGPTEPPPKCDADECGKITFGGKCSTAGTCERTCNDSFEKCTSFISQTILCPDGEDCVIHCAMGGCNELTCKGGHSCTFDCTGGDCHDAECESGSCTFRCKDNSCDDAECGENVAASMCTQLCFNGAGMKQDCKKGLGKGG